MKHHLLQIILVSVVFASLVNSLGCGPQPISKPAFQVDNALKALAILNQRTARILPFKANGRCRYEDAEFKHSFPLKIFFQPPDSIYLQGDIAFDPKAVTAGANPYEFWMAVRLQEVDTFWWGLWEDQKTLGTLKLRPELMLEVLGIFEIGQTASWQFQRSGRWDVLTKLDPIRPVKRVYIDTRDYIVSRIEYLGQSGTPIMIARLSEHELLTEGFWVPRKIQLIAPRVGQRGSSTEIEVKLSSIKTTGFSAKQQQALFTRPNTARFKHHYRIINGEAQEVDN